MRFSSVVWGVGGIGGIEKRGGLWLSVVREMRFRQFCSPPLRSASQASAAASPPLLLLLPYESVYAARKASSNWGRWMGEGMDE